MLIGASQSEIALVLFLLALVVVAPKVGRIGEALGARLGGGSPRDGTDDAGEGSGPGDR